MPDPLEQDLMPEPFDEPPIDVVPFVRRKLAWDMIPHDEVLEVLPLLNLVPSSAEGQDQEHLDSHVRTYQLESMRDLVQIYSALSAEILGVVLLPDSEEHPVTEEQHHRFDQQNFTVINTACYAILAQFVDDGLLVVPAATGGAGQH